MYQSFHGNGRGNGRPFGQRRSPQSFNRRPRANRPMGAMIDPTRYVKAAVQPQAEEVYEAQHQFSDFELSPQLLTNITRHGYVTPTPIQDQAIPAMVAGKDVVGIANTGTGKTAAFLLPLINKVVLDPNQGVLIVAPTRELAVQIVEEFRAFVSGLSISVSVCIGGRSLDVQVAQLRQNPHFVIGTPGRLKDVIQRGAFDPSMFSNIVLDEVDRMLDIGFRKDILFLIDHLPKQRQAAFFSATLDRSTEDIMRQLLTDPVRISLKKTDTNLHIEQDIIKVKPGQNKIDVLHELLQQEEFGKVIVFGRTKHGINKLEMELNYRGIRVSSIHGNKTQSARQKSLTDFKKGFVQALLATDVAARGIDIEDVTHVINYDEPQTYEDYIHRIGRTGRAGKMGKALTFVN